MYFVIDVFLTYLHDVFAHPCHIVFVSLVRGFQVGTREASRVVVAKW